MKISESEMKAPVGGAGSDWSYWLKNVKAIEKFIRANEVVAIGSSMKSGATTREFVDLGIRGGIKVPHLHFDNHIYLLDKQQWTKFSTTIISESKAKLEKVKEVSFDEGLMLGSLVETL